MLVLRKVDNSLLATIRAAVCLALNGILACATLYFFCSVIYSYLSIRGSQDSVSRTLTATITELIDDFADDLQSDVVFRNPQRGFSHDNVSREFMYAVDNQAHALRTAFWSMPHTPTDASDGSKNKSTEQPSDKKENSPDRETPSDALNEAIPGPSTPDDGQKGPCGHFTYITRFQESVAPQSVAESLITKPIISVVEDSTVSVSDSPWSPSRRKKQFPIRDELCKAISAFFGGLNNRPVSFPSSVKKSAQWLSVYRPSLANDSIKKPRPVTTYVMDLATTRATPSTPARTLNTIMRPWWRTFDGGTYENDQGLELTDPSGRSMTCYLTIPYATAIERFFQGNSYFQAATRTVVCRTVRSLWRNGDEIELYAGVDIVRAQDSLAESRALVETVSSKTNSVLASPPAYTKSLYSVLDAYKRAVLDGESVEVKVPPYFPLSVALCSFVVAFLFVKRMHLHVTVDLAREPSNPRPPSPTKEFALPFVGLKYATKFLISWHISRLLKRHQQADANTDTNLNSNGDSLSKRLHIAPDEFWKSTDPISLQSWDVRFVLKCVVVLRGGQIRVPLTERYFENVIVRFDKRDTISLYPETRIQLAYAKFFRGIEPTELDRALHHLVRTNAQGAFEASDEKYQKIFYRHPSFEVLKLRYGLENVRVASSLLRFADADSDDAQIFLDEKRPGRATAPDGLAVVRGLVAKSKQLGIDAVLYETYLTSFTESEWQSIKVTLEKWMTMGGEIRRVIVLPHGKNFAALPRHVQSLLLLAKEQGAHIKVFSPDDASGVSLNDLRIEPGVMRTWDFALLKVYGNSDDLVMLNGGMFVGSVIDHREKRDPSSESIFLRSDISWLEDEILRYRLIFDLLWGLANEVEEQPLLAHDPAKLSPPARYPPDA